MNVAGSKGDKVASRYRNKGLRVIAIDLDGSAKSESQSKWKGSGADYYLYDRDMNALQPFFKPSAGFPYNATIKEWKDKPLGAGVSEAQIVSAFGF